MSENIWRYKVLREQDGRLVSLIPEPVTEIVYTVYPEAVTEAPTGQGLYVFSSQRDAVAYMRRNNSLYRLWVFLVRTKNMVYTDTCLRPEYLNTEELENYWKRIRWHNSPGEIRERNNQCVQTYKLARAPEGTAFTRAIRFIRPLYFQPIPNGVLWEPTDDDLQRIGWTAT